LIEVNGISYEADELEVYIKIVSNLTKRITLLTKLVETKKARNEPYQWVSDMIVELEKILREA